MNIEQLYKDHSIIYRTEGHKHARDGWINTECPFCTGNPGYHLGYNTNNDRFVCWRCGGHYTENTISKLLNISYKEAEQLVRLYGGLTRKKHEKKKNAKIKPFKLPSNSKELQKNHRNYLIKRKFDPDRLIKDWGILGTSVLSRLDNTDYKHRIIIPIMWDGKIVSFDSRDITDKSKSKYMKCSEVREEIPHKSILYGKQEKWKDTGICVEGTFDVWRMGFNAFSTSGIKYTSAQLRLIAKTFKRVPVIFDNESQAIRQANKLIADLKFRNVDAFRVDIEGDPGGLSEKEAKYLLKQLI